MRTLSLTLSVTVSFLMTAGLSLATPPVTVEAPNLLAIGDQVFEGRQLKLREHASGLISINLDGRRIALVWRDPCSSGEGPLTIGLLRGRFGVHHLRYVRRGGDECRPAHRSAPLIASLGKGSITIGELVARKTRPATRSAQK